MTDEIQIQKYIKRGFSANVILLSIGSQKSPETILDYAKQLRKLNLGSLNT